MPANAQDVKLFADEDGNYDLDFDPITGDIISEEGFNTAIIVGLLTDRRAPSSLVADPARRRGWIGDILTADIQRYLGSILWVYEQSRITQNILNQIRVGAQDGLSSLLEDSIARDIEVNIIEAAEGIFIDIIFKTSNGQTNRYQQLWRRTGRA